MRKRYYIYVDRDVVRLQRYYFMDGETFTKQYLCFGVMVIKEKMIIDYSYYLCQNMLFELA